MATDLKQPILLYEHALILHKNYDELLPSEKLLRILKYSKLWINFNKDQLEGIKTDALFVAGVVLELLSNGESLSSINDSAPQDTILWSIYERKKDVDKRLNMEYGEITELLDENDTDKFMNLPEKIAQNMVLNASREVKASSPNVYDTSSYRTYQDKMVPIIKRELDQIV